MKPYVPDGDEKAIQMYTRTSENGAWTYVHFMHGPYQILATPGFHPDHVFEKLQDIQPQNLLVFADKTMQHIDKFWKELIKYPHPITVLWYTEERMDTANLIKDYADSTGQLTLYDSWDVEGA